MIVFPFVQYSICLSTCSGFPAVLSLLEAYPDDRFECCHHSPAGSSQLRHFLRHVLVSEHLLSARNYCQAPCELFLCYALPHISLMSRVELSISRRSERKKKCPFHQIPLRTHTPNILYSCWC